MLYGDTVKAKLVLTHATVSTPGPEADTSAMLVGRLFISAALRRRVIK